jgi:hypothetical protein
MQPTFDSLEQRNVLSTLSVTADGTWLSYRAAANEINNVSIVPSVDIMGNVTWTIEDSGALVGGGAITITCVAPFQGGNAPGVSATLANPQVTKITVYLEDQDDELNISVPVNTTAFGGVGNDTMLGGDGDDTFWGEDGNDLLAGFNGNDTLRGEAGTDELFGGLGDDRLYGGVGDDILYGHLGDDSLYGGDGHDRLYGEDGNDWLSGEDGNDSLLGGDGNDYVSGGDGQDSVFGGSGTDTLWGGADGDTFLGLELSEIQDFNPNEDELIA